MPDVGRRVWIVGNSGTGKTHLARRVSAWLGLPHLELDALNHRPGWNEAPVEELRTEVGRALDGFQDAMGGWVVDGNYRRRLADVVTADTYVWLDYPRPVVMRRVVGRTLGRVLTRRELWNGNRERWRSLLNPDPRENIILWAWVQQETYRRQYEAESARERNGTWIRLRSPEAAERWLAAVGCS